MTLCGIRSRGAYTMLAKMGCPLAQVRSGRPASKFVPSAHIVSVATDDIDFVRAIGVTFPFCALLVPGLVFPRTRLTNRKIARTTKATGTSSQPGIEPSSPTPSLNQRRSYST